MFTNVYYSLALMIFDAIVVITVFNFYIPVAKDRHFWKQFTEMVVLGPGIAVISVGIRSIVRHFIGI